MSLARDARRKIAVDTLLSVEEAARKLGGLSKYTIHAWLSSGKLRRTKVGSRTMIRESELQRVIEDGGKSPSARSQGAERA
jgi:excisionase family DNA binding protein